MNRLKGNLNKYIDLNYQWKDQYDVFHYPKDMPTRHLFYIIKMVWNHSAPEDLKLKPYKLYDFGNFYTPEYITKSIINIYNELNNRNDLTDYYKYCLNYMENHFNKCNSIYSIEVTR